MNAPALLPLEDGEQYRFTFAMDACVGCHSCEVACAEQNDRPVAQAWRRVGELEGGAYPHTRRFSLSIACNHCVEPTCLTGCPTKAYEKLANGIVVHHEDDCIGCQYCIWNCPYEVPVFNPVRKVVSKCDLCRPRIDAGQAPACVNACPTRAIGIEAVDVAAWRADHAEADAPGLPPSHITLSTTRILLPPDLPDDTSPANERPVQPEQPHTPLIVLTLLTQLSLGMVAATVMLELGGMGRAPLGGARTAAFVAGLLALGSSLFHLGRPARALKALRNLRTSWLSREVALFGLFSGLSFAYAAGAPLGVAALAAGVAGVYASAKLYLVPARPVWDSARTPVAFFATAAATGPLAALLCLDRARLDPAWVVALAGLAAAGTLAQVAVHAQLVAVARRRHRGTYDLLTGRFQDMLGIRLGLAAVALGLLGFALAAPIGGADAGGRFAAAAVFAGGGEVIGRYLFYVTVVPYRIAGNFFGAR